MPARLEPMEATLGAVVAFDRLWEMKKPFKKKSFAKGAFHLGPYS